NSMHRSAVMATMMPVAAVAEANRLELEPGDAGRDIQSGLALHADRLQRIGIARAADQEVAAAADADRRIGADTAIAAGELAIGEPRGRRTDGPGDARLRGDAEIEPETPHGGDIGLGPMARALEHAFEARHRANDKADILPAAAFENARLHRRHRLRAGERTRKRGGGDNESGKSHV